MRGTSQMDRSSVKTRWVGGIYPGLVQRVAERPVRAVEGVEGGCSAGTPVDRSATTRIKTFFNDNPDEELGVNDAVVKFFLARETANTLLSALRKSGFLARRKEGCAVFYSKAGTL